MAVSFPDIVPTSRSFSAPTWPTTSTTSQSGVISRRLWGSSPSKASLSLTYSNISDTNAALILNAYNTAKGATTDLTLPSSVLTGMGSSLTLRWATAIASAGLKWYFSENEPPSVESVVPGRSTVKVTLVAELSL